MIATSSATLHSPVSCYETVAFNLLVIPQSPISVASHLFCQLIAFEARLETMIREQRRPPQILDGNLNDGHLPSLEIRDTSLIELLCFRSFDSSSG